MIPSHDLNSKLVTAIPVRVSDSVAVSIRSATASLCPLVRGSTPALAILRCHSRGDPSSIEALELAGIRIYDASGCKASS